MTGVTRIISRVCHSRVFLWIAFGFSIAAAYTEGLHAGEPPKQGPHVVSCSPYPRPRHSKNFVCDPEGIWILRSQAKHHAA